MFWKRFGFQHVSGIDSLLDREDVELEAILDEDDLLNECKSQNTRLIDYFQRIDVLRKLLGYASGEIEGEGMGRYKYPHVATEVLCSEIWSIVETCLREADQLLVPFWDALLDMNHHEMSQRSHVAPHFTKINAVFISKKPEEMFHFIRTQPSVLDRIFRHIETPAFVDLIFRIIQLEDFPGGAGVIEWLSAENFIPRLVALLSPQHSPDVHNVVADVLKGIIAICAPSPGNANDNHMALVANRFARQLASEDVVHTFVGYMLDEAPEETANDTGTNTSKAPSSMFLEADPDQVDSFSSSSSDSASSESEYHSVVSTRSERSTSSLLHISSVLIELMRKNNSDFFEPYLFHTLRQRLIQIQQQYLPQLDRSGMDPSRRAEDDRDILEQTMADMVNHMGIVNFSVLLNALGSRLHEFQALLQSPRSPTVPILTTIGAITPLTLERFRICELYAELLHCSSLSLQNRSAGYGPTYDAEGRLVGGLAALEELARVIANGANEPPSTPPPQPPRAFDSESPSSSRDFTTSTDHLSTISGSSGGDTEYLSNIDDSDEDSDDMGHMEEIDMHDELREPLPEAPFAVSPQDSTTPRALESPEIHTSTLPDVTSTDEPLPARSLESLETEIDPFTDPNEIPPSPPAEGVGIDKSFASLDSSRMLSQAEETPHEPPGEPTDPVSRPPGEFLKSRFLDLHVITTILDLFFDFPWNNFLHNVVYDLLHQLMTGRTDRGLNRELVISLFRDGRLLHRIVEAQARNDVTTTTPQGVRLGYMGHLTLISEDVIAALAHYPPDLTSILSEYAPQPEWDVYVSGRFKETKERDSSQLGGGKPVVLPGQAQALRASLAAAGRGTGLPAGLAVDEEDRIPPGGVGRGNGIGASPVSNVPRPVQNVVFAPANEDETPEANSDQFARYLVQQINGTTNSQFESSSSSDDSGDDDDDVGWLGDAQYSGDFEPQPSPPVFEANGVGRRSRSNSTSKSPASSTFDDSFGDFSALGSSSSRSGFDDNDDDGDFGPFADPALSEAVHSNFAADLSGDFSFPSTSSSPSFDLDADFGKADGPTGFTFGNGTSTFDDDDDFGDFQGGVGIEVVMSTNADGVSESLEETPAPNPDEQTSHEDEGERTPKAFKTHFDDHFGEDSFQDVDPDPFGFRHRALIASEDSDDGDSNTSNALATLEQTFGKVSLNGSSESFQDSFIVPSSHPSTSSDHPKSILNGTSQSASARPEH